MLTVFRIDKNELNDAIKKASKVAASMDKMVAFSLHGTTLHIEGRGRYKDCGKTHAHFRATIDVEMERNTDGSVKQSDMAGQLIFVDSRTLQDAIKQQPKGELKISLDHNADNGKVFIDSGYFGDVEILDGREPAWFEADPHVVQHDSIIEQAFIFEGRAGFIREIANDVQHFFHRDVYDVSDAHLESVRFQCTQGKNVRVNATDRSSLYDDAIEADLIDGPKGGAILVYKGMLKQFAQLLGTSKRAQNQDCVIAAYSNGTDCARTVAIKFGSRGQYMIYTTERARFKDGQVFYPAVDMVIPHEHTVSVTLNRADVMAYLEQHIKQYRIDCTIDPESQSVNVIVSGLRDYVEGTSADFAADIQGHELNIGFDPARLYGVFQACHTDTVTLHLESPGRAALVKGPYGETFLVAPMGPRKF